MKNLTKRSEAFDKIAEIMSKKIEFECDGYDGVIKGLDIIIDTIEKINHIIKWVKEDEKI